MLRAADGCAEGTNEGPPERAKRRVEGEKRWSKGDTIGGRSQWDVLHRARGAHEARVEEEADEQSLNQLEQATFPRLWQPTPRCACRMPQGYDLRSLIPPASALVILCCILHLRRLRT